MTNYTMLLPSCEEKIHESPFDKYKNVLNHEETNHFIEIQKIRENLFKDLFLTIHNNSKEKLKEILQVHNIKFLKYDIKNNLEIKTQKTSYVIDRFSGMMIKSIQYDNMNKKQQNNFCDAVVFIDGLFGLLKPFDKIPNYKFGINVQLKNINVMDYWKENLSEFFDEIKQGVVIDLMPPVYTPVLSKRLVNSDNYCRINFSENVKGKIKNVGYKTNKLKGEFINYICKFDNVDFEILKNFNHSNGFVFDEKLSSENEIVYLKK